jgi:hypothetical protein
VGRPFYEWSKDGTDDDPAPDTLPALADALLGVQQLLANPTGEELNYTRLADAIADTESEWFGPPVARFNYDPGMVVGYTTDEWLERLEAVRGKIDETLRFLDLMWNAARSAPRPPRKRGAKPGKRDLRAAVGVLANYWTDVLGQKFTVVFDREKPPGATRQRRRTGERGQFERVHETKYRPTSAAAKFVCAAMGLVDPARTAEEIDAIMKAVKHLRG